ncbi:hypothetical protein GCM10028807_05240 [Spirosoma daeguense]
MKYSIIGLLAFSLLIPFTSRLKFSAKSSVTYHQEEVGSPILPIMSSNWVATDGAGRTLPTYAVTGDFKKNKYVGIFYFLWHGAYNDKGVYNNSVIIKANPTNPKFGPETAFHWWGEPEAGFFKADDPWVIRRNLQMLTEAGVDILFLDTTNGDAYLPVVNKLCEISKSMRQKGIPTPYICFVTYTKPNETVKLIYDEFYAQNKHSELWFRWQGKPLMLGKKEEITDPSMRDFFTWRFSWAWTNARNEPHNWQWLDRTPQNYGWDTNPSIPEEIPVAVASHPFDNGIGKSFRQGREGVLNKFSTTTSMPQGLYFEEQWKRALQVNPSVVFVAGWNEWVAQHYVYRPSGEDAKKPGTKYMGKPMKPGQSFFIDLYNEEYNRDAEPMKGGYTDNYYYQLVANIRKFKGMPAPEKSTPARTIPIDGKFAEWASVKPHFIDPNGDVMHRNWPRSDGKINYVNNTGRNDITDLRITADAKNTYFYAKSDKKLTLPTGKNWMLLYIDTDQSAKTGWAGYDFLISHATSGNKSTISRWNGKSWVPVSAGTYRYANNELEVSLPLSAIRQTAGKVKLDFHWADNIQERNSLNEFFLNGDSAPDRRFNYRYIGQ